MIGDVLEGRFEIEREIGAGGMGRVYRAVDRQLGKPVAVKIVGAASTMAVRRFARESAILAELQHPGVVDYVAHGNLPSGLPYLVMEWLDGIDLASWLRERGTPWHAGFLATEAAAMTLQLAAQWL